MKAGINQKCEEASKKEKKPCLNKDCTSKTESLDGFCCHYCKSVVRFKQELDKI